MVFDTAVSEVAVIFLGFSASMEVGDGFHLMEGDGRGKRRNERAQAGERGREGFSLLKSKSKAEMVDIQDSRAFVRSTLLASLCTSTKRFAPLIAGCRIL